VKNNRNFVRFFKLNQNLVSLVGGLDYIYFFIFFCFFLAYCRLNGQITGPAGHVFRSGRVCISTNAKWESIQMLCKYLNADNAGALASGSCSCR